MKRRFLNAPIIGDEMTAIREISGEGITDGAPDWVPRVPSRSLHMAFRVLSALAVVAIAACIPATVKYAPVTAYRLAPGNTANIEVNSAATWRDTGIEVYRDELYKISAKGVWSNWGACPSVGAGGLKTENLFCMKGIWTNSYAIPSAPLAALLGKIGENGEPFLIGDTRSFMAQSDGTLFLGINEINGHHGDNVGVLQVMIAPLGGAITSRATPVPAVAQPAQVVQTVSSIEQSGFSMDPMAITFRKGPPRPDDIAVIIGNADYQKQGKDIPNVKPAYSDAASFKEYAMTTLGVREGNIIDMRDATGAQMNSVFGSETHQQGQLSDWVRKDTSNVYVYYAGHGAPGGSGGNSYLIPSDADASRIEINGYGLKTLYSNLSLLPAKTVTVVLEACFSGASQSGTVISNASPVFLKAKTPDIPSNITVIAAGASDQMASWENDGSNGLFTKYYLKGMSGEADAKPSGNGDGTVTHDELKAYLEETLTYYARRYYGRDQRAVIIVGNGQ